MAALARELGVPADRIVVESISTSTWENARRTAPLLRSKGVERILLVTDSLHMRRAEGCFRKAIEMARRQQSKLTLLVADIDQFKAFIEAYGAESADDCLRRVAVEFSGGLHRGGDLGARFRGDEFAALLPATGGAGAGVVAQEIAQRVLGLVCLSLEVFGKDGGTRTLNHADGAHSRRRSPGRWESPHDRFHGRGYGQRSQWHGGQRRPGGRLPTNHGTR